MQNVKADDDILNQPTYESTAISPTFIEESPVNFGPLSTK